MRQFTYKNTQKDISDFGTKRKKSGYSGYDSRKKTLLNVDPLIYVYKL